VSPRDHWRVAASTFAALAACTASTEVKASDDRGRCAPQILFSDDFSRLPAGRLIEPRGAIGGHQGGAIHEYHHVSDRGVPLAPWVNATCHLDAWIAGDEDGQAYLEQHGIASGLDVPVFVTGDAAWSDYATEAHVRPLALEGRAGLVFRYKTIRHHYFLALEGGRRLVLGLRRPLDLAFHQPDVRELAAAPFAHDVRRTHRLRIEGQGRRLRGYVDGRLVLEVTDAELAHGRAGLYADTPARFQHFRVTTCARDARAVAQTILGREADLAKLRADNPRPVVWRRFRTPGFGAGRNVRFGDLDGDGALDMLIGQTVPRVESDSFAQLSALTAVTLEGKVLWQSGRASRRNALLTGDTPFQIHDVDGDGRADVVLVRDFKLQILDGKTGAVKRWVWMPPMPPPSPTAQRRFRPYERHPGDALTFVNLTGDPARRELLVKDRYKRFWMFDRTLRPLWRGETNTGHYPFPVDLDGDQRDEILVGYSLWTSDGRRRWALDQVMNEHADAVVAGNFTGDPRVPPRVYWSASDEGFVMLDLEGRVLRHVRLGHAQSASVARFRPDLPGLQYMTVNFWHSPGIVTLLDAEGQVLAQEQPIHEGSSLLPVNWRGDGQEFALLSGAPDEGGMHDRRSPASRGPLPR
jgi:hypothetical protein